MSIYSDYKVGAISDDEFRNECARINREDRWEQEDLQIDDGYDEYEKGEEDD